MQRGHLLRAVGFDEFNTDLDEEVEAHVASGNSALELLCQGVFVAEGVLVAEEPIPKYRTEIGHG